MFWYGLQIALRVAVGWYLAQAPAVIDASLGKTSATDLARINTDNLNPLIYPLRSVRSVALFIAWLCRFFLADALADFELHLAGFLVGVDDHVIAVQDFAVENLQRQWILDQLLDRALQGRAPKFGS